MREEYNKLVRDRIPEIIHQSGKQCEVVMDGKDVVLKDEKGGMSKITAVDLKGSNGVIQIFTKRGRTGAPEWLYEIEGGFERSPTNRFPGRLWTQFTGPTGYRAHDPKEIVENGRYERYLAWYGKYLKGEKGTKETAKAR